MRKLYEVKKDYESGELSLVAHELLKVERDWFTIGPGKLAINRHKRKGIGTTRKAAIDSFKKHHLGEIARCKRWIAEHEAALAAVEALGASNQSVPSEKAADF